MAEAKAWLICRVYVGGGGNGSRRYESSSKLWVFPMASLEDLMRLLHAAPGRCAISQQARAGVDS